MYRCAFCVMSVRVGLWLRCARPGPGVPSTSARHRASVGSGSIAGKVFRQPQTSPCLSLGIRAVCECHFDKGSGGHVILARGRQCCSPFPNHYAKPTRSLAKTPVGMRSRSPARRRATRRGFLVPGHVTLP